MNAERLVSRCLTVDITVSVPRSDAQEQALKQADNYLEQIKIDLHKDLANAEKHVQRLLNACCSETSDGPVDSKFQSIVLGCTAEDQKKIRKRLHTWLDALAKTESDIK